MNEHSEVTASACDSHHTDNFDRIIGLIEDIVISSEFQVIFGNIHLSSSSSLIAIDCYVAQQKQNEFLEKNYELFTEDEENKICYTEIFNEYTTIIETFIVDHLKASVCDEEMNRFLTELR